MFLVVKTCRCLHVFFGLVSEFVDALVCKSVGEVVHFGYVLKIFKGKAIAVSLDKFFVMRIDVGRRVVYVHMPLYSEKNHAYMFAYQYQQFSAS